jgi:hypothetical protein
MRARILSSLALSAAIFAGSAGAADVANADPLSNFLDSCRGDSQSCRTVTLNIVTAAKNNHYDCIPSGLSPERAADRELAWLEDAAQNNPKFKKMDLQDVLWSGVDHLWPCNKRI